MEVTPEELATPDSITVRALKDITFGSIAGITSKFFEHPFDLTKVRLQSQVLDATARFAGPLDCLVQTFRKEGVRGLYRVRLPPPSPFRAVAEPRPRTRTRMGRRSGG